MSKNAIEFNSIIYNNNNILSVILQMESEEGGVYTYLTSTFYEIEMLFYRPSTQEEHFQK